MSRLPRLLAIMGSGETSPTMARVQRGLLARLGPAPVPAVMLDTPAAFQENVAQLGARLVDYFQRHLQQPLTVLAVGGDVDRPGPSGAEALARLTEAHYVFAGPGSPSFTLTAWSGTAVPGLLRDKLAHGGALAFSSAAALTLGAFTLPVYELYKVGQAPYWLPGLDLLAVAGLPVAVLPHFDNRDGGDHDTRYCFMGERRLTRLEADLPAGAFILGVDEHTAAIFDLDAATVEVAGRGGLTVRVAGASEHFPRGSRLAIAALTQTAERLAAKTLPGAVINPGQQEPGDLVGWPRTAPGEDLALHASQLAEVFTRRLAAGDTRGAAELALVLEAALDGGAEPAGRALARGYLQTMLLRLGEAAAAGGDRRATLEPLVTALLNARAAAREAGQWELADSLRGVLEAAQVRVQDSPDGSHWELAE